MDLRERYKRTTKNDDIKKTSKKVSYMKKEASITLSVRQMADLLNVSEAKVRELIKVMDIPVIPNLRTIRVLKTEFDKAFSQ